MQLSDDDLREIFGLFTSCSKFEKGQTYDEASEHFFGGVDLAEEYELTEPKREYALDAWRAVMYFLHRKGYAIEKDGWRVDLSWAEDEFL